jgi:hypothetical protein
VFVLKFVSCLLYTCGSVFLADTFLLAQHYVETISFTRRDFALRLPDEDYSRNASWAIDLIFKFLFTPKPYTGCIGRVTFFLHFVLSHSNNIYFSNNKEGPTVRITENHQHYYDNSGHFVLKIRGPSWSSSYGRWISNCLCNQCLFRSMTEGLCLRQRIIYQYYEVSV